MSGLEEEKEGQVLESGHAQAWFGLGSVRFGFFFFLDF